MEVLEHKGAQVFQLQADSCTCGICLYQCSDAISLIVHKTQHAIAEGVYKCDLCQSLHGSQESLCNHYVGDHKVLILFTKTDVLSEDMTEMPGEQAATLQGDTMAVIGSEEASMSSMDLISKALPVESLTNDHALFNSKDVKAVHIEVTQQPEADSSDTALQLSTGATSLIEASNHSDLTRHVTNDKQLKFLLVTECNASCERPYLKTWFLCLFCPYKTRTRVAFNKHVNNIHKRTKVKESLSEADIVERSGVKEGKSKDVTFGWNLMTMEDYDKFVPVVSTAKDDLAESCPKKNERRLEKQDIRGNFPCSSCSKVFSRLRYLRRHLVTHKDDKPHACSECKKCFKTLDQLKAHRKTCLKPNRLYECPQCDFKSKINTVIHAHRQLHPDGCIICDVCGKAYADKSTLMKHMQVHDPNRPFACTYSGCMWRFKSEVMYRAHLRAHNTKGKFLCSYCGYAFRHKHHLLRHQSSVHGIDPPKTRPYGQSMKLDPSEQDMVEIPADQLEIHETAFLDQPIFMTGEPDGIISEQTDLSSINTLIPTHVATKQDCDMVFEQKLLH